jgi:hypothetical protein
MCILVYEVESVLPMLPQPHAGMAIQVWVPDTRRVPDTTGTGMGTIFYPWVAPVPDPNRDGYGTGIFFHLRVSRRIPNTLLPL